MEYIWRCCIGGIPIGWDGIGMLMTIVVVYINRILTSMIKNSLISSMINISMLISFSSMSTLYFIIMYEYILIPLTVLVINKGSKRKKEGVIKLLYYTMLSSILILIMICSMIRVTGGTLNEIISVKGSEYWRMLAVIVFLVKIPIYPFHSWLTMALSESNMIGSIYLSSIVLKVSIYGIYRYGVSIDEGGVWFKEAIYTIGIITALYSSIVIFMELDIKRVIGYYSVILMSQILVSIMIGSTEGRLSTMLIGVTLSIISSGLFYIFSLLYEVYLSRNILYFRKIYMNSFILREYITILMLSNMSFPMTCNYIPEYTWLYSLYGGIGILGFINLVSVFNTTVLSLWLMTRMLYGSVNILLKRFVDISRYLLILLLYLLIPNICLGYSISPLVSLLDSTVYI